MAKDLRSSVLGLFKQFSGQKRVLTIPRPYLDMTGNHMDALLLNQIVFWSDRTKDPEGWFYKSYEEWQDELGMSTYQVRRAAAALAPFGVEVKLKKANGAPTLHYRLNQEIFIDAILKFLNIPKSSSSTILDFEETSQSITEDDQKKTTPVVGVKDDNPKLTEIIRVYERNIGVIAELALHRLKVIAEKYPDGWFADATEIAVANNKRKLSYIEGVLDKWETNGRGYKPGAPRAERSAADPLEGAGQTPIDYDEYMPVLPPGVEAPTDE